MKSAVIICNGAFPESEYPRYLIRSADHIICCDGAFETWLHEAPSIFGKDSEDQAVRLPDAVVGDMDSLPEEYAKKYGSIIHHVAEQDSNDMMKAYRHLRANLPGIEEIHFIGATGKRDDHTLGNLGHLMQITKELALAHEDVNVDMVSDFGTAFSITDTCDLYVGEGRTVSIISPDNSLKITSAGLQWQTSGVTFDNWWPATLNRATTDIIRLTLSHPSMVLVYLPA